VIRLFAALAPHYCGAPVIIVLKLIKGRTKRTSSIYNQIYEFVANLFYEISNCKIPFIITQKRVELRIVTSESVKTGTIRTDVQ
jgi:hypothetical protein